MGGSMAELGTESNCDPRRINNRSGLCETPKSQFSVRINITGQNLIRTFLSKEDINFYIV